MRRCSRTEGHRTRYASVAGKPNPKQPGLIKAAVAKMVPGAFIVAAFDADEAGGELAENVRGFVSETGRKDLFFRVSLPSREGSDWNEVHCQLIVQVTLGRAVKP